MTAGRQRAARWVRFGICGLLLVAIFHVIFCNEVQLQLAASGGQWSSLSRWEQRRLAWTRGPAELWNTARRIETGPLAASFLLMGAPIFLGGLRWRLALRVQGLDLSTRQVTHISLVAHFFNAFLLGSTGGDVVKAWYAARATHHKRAEAALTVFVDRLLGTLSLLAGAVLALPAVWSLLIEYRRYQFMALAVGGMLAVALGAVFAGFFTDALGHHGWLSRWLHRIPRGASVARALASCRLFGRHSGFLAAAAALSVAINVVIVVIFVLLAAGLGVKVPASAFWFVGPAVVCVSALPITPNGLGVRENLLVWLLAIPAFPGVKPAEALAVSLVCFTLNLVWSALGGVVYLFLPDRHELAQAGVPPDAGSAPADRGAGVSG